MHRKKHGVTAERRLQRVDRAGCSRYPDKRSWNRSGQIAQLVEHRTENPGVAGSIPALPIDSRRLVDLWRWNPGQNCAVVCGAPGREGGVPVTRRWRMTHRGRVRNEVIFLDPLVALPEGCQVEVAPVVGGRVSTPDAFNADSG